VDECNTVEELSGYAPCACRISLPANVDTNEVVADFVEDMLEIQLPKLAMAS
jgi:HSP20 family molecular chaperone IbpA